MLKRAFTAAGQTDIGKSPIFVTMVNNIMVIVINIINILVIVVMELREGCTKQKPEKSGLLPKGGGVSGGRKMPNLYFGVLKKGQKWPKNGQKTH